MRTATRVPLARRNLFQERRRAALAVAGVAMALLLVLVLQGIFDGAMRQVTAYIHTSEADLFVSQQGVRTMHMSASALPPGIVERLRAERDVAWAAPIRFAPNAFVESDKGRELSYVIGYDGASGRGGPSRLTSGRAPGPGEALLDRVAAGRLGVGPGDRIRALGASFTISGLSSGGTSIINTTAFIRGEDFVRLRGPTVSYVLVGGRPGIGPGELARRLQAALPDATVQTRAELAGQEAGIVRDMSADVMRIMSTIGFLIALAVVALTMFTATLAKLREYAVTKAIGAGPAWLARTVLAQAAWAVGVALVLAVGLAVAVGAGVAAATPNLRLAIEPASVLRTAMGALLVGGIGSVLPLRRVTKVDPASVFQEGMVTPLSSEDDSFSGRLSGLKGKPCPEDVRCSHQIGVPGVPAGNTAEVPLAGAVLPGDVPAGRAGAGGVVGFHRHDQASGAFSLVRKDGQEYPPTRVQDRAVQARLPGDTLARRVHGPGRGAGHVANVQRLVRDQVVIADQGERGLVGVVEPLPTDLAVQRGGPLALLVAPVGAALAAGETLLRAGQSRGRGGEPPGIGDLLAGRGGQEARHPQVDADRRAGSGQWPGRHVVAGQHDVPTTAFPLHTDRLHLAFDRPVGVDTHLSDALQGHAPLVGQPPAAVPVLGPGHSVEPAPPLEPRVAGRHARLEPPEERTEGAVQSAQRGLLGGERPAALSGWVGSADVLQLGGLLGVMDSNPAHPVGGAAVLQRAIVKLPVVLQHRRQRPRLLGSGAQQELEGAAHDRIVAAGCDRPERERRWGADPPIA